VNQTHETRLSVHIHCKQCQLVHFNNKHEVNTIYKYAQQSAETETEYKLQHTKSAKKFCKSIAVC